MSLYSNLTSFGRLLPECQARPAECVPMPSKGKVGGYIHIWADFQFPMMMAACLIPSSPLPSEVSQMPRSSRSRC